MSPEVYRAVIDGDSLATATQYYVGTYGRLRTVAYTPRTNLPTLEADLYDGSDVVTLVFLGRRSIVGIEPGRQLTARGRIAIRDDRKVIYNPYYELEAPR